MILAALVLAAAPVNLKVLDPATPLIPVMTVMANSLGVTCLHCHDDRNWPSDAKPAKEAARQMLRMTRAINDTHYGGKVVVTCNTCHHSSVATSPVPLIANAGWNKPATIALRPTLPPAEELFERYVRAWGKPAAVRHSVGVASGRSGRGDPRSAPFELQQELLPKKTELKMELSYPPEADREFISQFFNYAKIRERYASVVTKGADEIRGRAAWVVEAQPTDGSLPETLWFDAATGHLLRRHREQQTIVGILPEEYDFDDYRDVGGSMVPFLLQWSRADYQVTHRFATVTH